MIKLDLETHVQSQSKESGQ